MCIIIHSLVFHSFYFIHPMSYLEDIISLLLTVSISSWLCYVMFISLACVGDS